MDRTRTLYEQCWSEMRVLEEAAVIVGLVHVKESEINGLWVHPSRQGTGAGTLLLGTGEDAIREQGHRVAWLTCSAFNRNALGFYVHRGYVETGRNRFLQESGVEVEDVRLERDLEPPNPGTV